MNTPTLVLMPAEPLRIVIDGHTIQLEHIRDADGGHALQLGGVDCNLEGEQPGLYYPTPFAIAS
ncbi:MAG: hypothetical protein RB191_11555 [Terriglobia bacterium]|nr:hypothetical protein [Terriglobia bacterium]